MLEFMTSYADKFYQSIDAFGEVLSVAFAWVITIAAVIVMGSILIAFAIVIGETIIGWANTRRTKHEL